jgi:enoyl-CoA hydratase/carnithine racemase
MKARETIRTRIEDRVAVVTLHRPERPNGYELPRETRAGVVG